jgi:hypothetical protein
LGAVDGPVRPAEAVLLDVAREKTKPVSLSLEFELLTQVLAVLQVPNSPIHSGCGLLPVTR